MLANPASGIKRAYKSDPNANREWRPEEWTTVMDRAPVHLKTAYMIARHLGYRSQSIVVVGWLNYQSDGRFGRCFRMAHKKNNEQLRMIAKSPQRSGIGIPGWVPITPAMWSKKPASFTCSLVSNSAWDDMTLRHKKKHRRRGYFLPFVRSQRTRTEQDLENRRAQVFQIPEKPSKRKNIKMKGGPWESWAIFDIAFDFWKTAPSEATETNRTKPDLENRKCEPADVERPHFPGACGCRVSCWIENPPTGHLRIFHTSFAQTQMGFSIIAPGVTKWLPLLKLSPG
jgi:hypothetical protein